MKTQKILFTVIISILLTSCSTTTYFQVYKVAPSGNLVNKDSLLVYEDENCKITYNLWKEGGNIGFKFFNKTDKNIYLHLEESFFILNGISYNYYKNRVFTYSTSSAASTSRSSTSAKSTTDVNYLDLLQTDKILATNTLEIMSSLGFSVSYNEEKIVCIPSKTSKVISEYSIKRTLYSDCDLHKYPPKKQIISKTFSKEQSPLVFSNRIAYTIGQSDSLIKIENEFYVMEISNYPESEMCELRYEEYCGKKSKIKHFKNVSPDKFYIIYTKQSMITN